MSLAFEEPAVSAGRRSPGPIREVAPGGGHHVDAVPVGEHSRRHLRDDLDVSLMSAAASICLMAAIPALPSASRDERCSMSSEIFTVSDALHADEAAPGAGWSAPSSLPCALLRARVVFWPGSMPVRSLPSAGRRIGLAGRRAADAPPWHSGLASRRTPTPAEPGQIISVLLRSGTPVSRGGRLSRVGWRCHACIVAQPCDNSRRHCQRDGLIPRKGAGGTGA